MLRLGGERKQDTTFPQMDWMIDAHALKQVAVSCCVVSRLTVFDSRAPQNNLNIIGC